MDERKVKVSCLNCGQTNYYPDEAQEKKSSADGATVRCPGRAMSWKSIQFRLLT